MVFQAVEASEEETRMVAVITEEFTLFPNLPFELRAKIWNGALPEPQSVILDEDNIPPVFTDGVLQHWWLPRCKAHCKFPTILHVNQESRAEALRSYRPAFGALLKDKPVFFNFLKDRIIINGAEAIESFRDGLWNINSPDLDQDADDLRFICIQLRILKNYASNYAPVTEVNEAKTKLCKEILMVSGKRERVGDEPDVTEILFNPSGGLIIADSTTTMNPTLLNFIDPEVTPRQ
ncbi:hypothetical protein B7494_g3452 [Chlorociboria aeruginascens]|nr:hypothetical protein B7494_g3452 [Chlorociboria aeruginascens]